MITAAFTVPATADNRQTMAELLDASSVRALAEALRQGTAGHWRRRAATLDDARPRETDYAGQAGREALAAADERCVAAAQACRNAAYLVEVYGVPSDEVAAALVDVDEALRDRADRLEQTAAERKRAASGIRAAA